MSVQAGIWNFDGMPVDEKLLAQLGASLAKQGPDGESFHVEGSVGVLYRPFNTTVESYRETQPLGSPGGSIVTWDGRLDNREDLLVDFREELGAEATDAALVAAAFDRWETACFRRLIGDWAVSIWTPRKRELILAVDYLAIRHIFYELRKNRIWWSTDLTPLVLLSGETFHIDEDYIAGYLAHDPDAHLTPYRGIREVPPGQHVRIRGKHVVVQRHWSFDSNSRIRYRTDAQYEEHFRDVFRNAVRRRLRANSPVLAELSGGLDSSSIVCMADDIIANEGAETPRLDTLSLYDKTEPNGDDWIYFEKIERKRGRIGAHIDLSKLAVCPAPLQYDEFIPLPGYFGPTRRISAERDAIMTNGGYRVVLSGSGGDEFLGGMPDPRPQLGDLIVQLKLVSLVQQLVAWGLVKRKPLIQLLWQSAVELLPARLAQYVAKEAKLEPWIVKDFAKRTNLSVRQLAVEQHCGLWLPSRRSYMAAVVQTANKMAKHTAPSTVMDEMRFPYLDQHLIEFVLSIPASQLLRPGQRRSLMRRSLTGIVPSEVLLRRTKGISMHTPLAAMGRYWEELSAAFANPLTAHLGYIDRLRFVDKLNTVRNGMETQIIRTLKTISLEFWLRDLAKRGLIDSGKISPSSSVAVPLEAAA